jgi:hypothetical protein
MLVAVVLVLTAVLASDLHELVATRRLAARRRA